MVHPATLALLTLAVPLPAQKTPHIQLGTVDGLSLPPAIARSNQSIHVGWTDHLKSSHDGGATWSDADAGVAGDFVQLASAGDSIYVIWRTTFGPPFDEQHWVNFNYSVDRGNTWQTPVVLNTAGRAEEPVLVASGSSVYVVWRDAAVAPGLDDIVVNRSNDGGATWQATPTVIETLSVNFGTIYLTAKAYGSAVYAAWANSSVFLNRSLDNGATWLASSSRVDADVAHHTHASHPNIAPTDTSLCVVWNDFQDNDNPGFDCQVRMNRSTDQGVTWPTADVQIDHSPSDATTVHATSSGSNIYAVWEDDRMLASHIYSNRSIDGGVTWQASDTHVNQSTGLAIWCGHPRVLASNDSVYVCWREGAFLGSDVNIRLNYSSDRGVNWEPSTMRINSDDDPLPRRSWPQMALSDSGLAVAWFLEHNVQPTPDDVYFNIAFGFQSYGSGTVGSGGDTPSTQGTGLPTRGNSFAMEISNALPDAHGCFLVGFEPESKISLPFLGGDLLVSPTLGLPLTTDAAGNAAVPLTVPNQPSFRGLNVNAQGVILDAGAPAGVAMTHALETWIG